MQPPQLHGVKDMSHTNRQNICNIELFEIRRLHSISRNKLIYKLKTFGICGKILLWIKEFLNNRSFAVKLNNYLSKSLPVISSVPQGSKL